MPRYVDHPTQPEFEMAVPDDATDEQVSAQWRQFDQDRRADLFQAKAARGVARAENPMGDVQEGPVTPEGQQAQEETMTQMAGRAAMAPITALGKVPGKMKETVAGLGGLLTGKWLQPPAERAVGPEEQEFLDMLSRGESVGEFPINPYDPGAQALGKAIPPIVGGAIGAVGGPVGAGLGVMGGEALVKAFERSQAAQRGEPVQDPIEMIEDLLATGYLGGATEGIARLPGKALAAPPKAFQKTITPPGREAGAALPFEARPSLAQISSSRAADITENVAEASLLGGGRVLRQKGTAAASAEAKVRQVAENLPPKGAARFNVLEREIEGLGSQVFVDVAETREIAKQLLKKERPLGAFGADDKFMKVVEDISRLGEPTRVATPGGGAGFMAELAAPGSYLRPNPVDFVTLKNIRHNLLELARAPVGVLASQAEGGAVRHLSKLLTRNMEASAAGTPRLTAAFKEWNTLGRQASTRGHFEDMLTRATSTRGDVPVLDGAKLRSDLFHAKRELRGTLDPDALARFEKFARVLQTAQSKSAEGTGRVMVQLTQAGAMAGLATGLVTGTVPQAAAVATLVVPWVMARAITSPRFYSYLTEGFQHAGTIRGNAAINRMLEEMGAEEQEREPTREVDEYKAPWEVE